MKSLEDTTQTLINNYNAVNQYLTDFVAAEESGFGSQPVTSKSNWLIGRIIVERLSLFSHLITQEAFKLSLSKEEIETYLIENETKNIENRKGFAELRIALKASQAALEDFFENLDRQDANKNFESLSDKYLLNNNQVKDKTVYEVLEIFATQESEYVLDLKREQRQNGKTGIY